MSNTVALTIELDKTQDLTAAITQLCNQQLFAGYDLVSSFIHENIKLILIFQKK